MIPLLFGCKLRKLYSLVTGLLFFICAHSQSPTITNVSFNNTPTYFPGGSISLHIEPKGVFPLQTKFYLQLMDATGTTVVANIDTVNDFFVPVLNGKLPTTLPAGNYRLRAVADSAGVVVAHSPPTAPFTVQENPAAFDAPQIDNPSTLLKVNCFQEDNYFGYLDRKTGDVTPSNIGFEIPGDPSFTYKVDLLRPSGQRTNLPVTAPFGTPVFNIPPGLPTDYYTIEVTKSKDGFSSVSSYVFLFNTGNTTLANVGPENVCVFSEVLFSVNFPNLVNNYPGSYYTINYGDGSKVDTFSQAMFFYNRDVNNNVILSHIYTVATCKAPQLNKNGRFEVQILLYNKGVNANNNALCDVYSRNGNGTIKLVNTSIAPMAVGGGPSVICINKPATFVNSTINGVYGEGAVCLEEPNIAWFIKAPNSTTFASVPGTWYNNPRKNLNVPANIFNIVGIWQVKLTAQNPEGCNNITEDVMLVCVEPELKPDFTMNGSNAIAGCLPFDINVKNLTPRSPCQEYTYSWTVLDSLGVDTATGDNYTFVAGPDTLHPVLRFHKEGKFLLRLTVENSCGKNFIDKPIEILGITDVSFPNASSRVCGAGRVIDFGRDTAFIPKYNTFFAPTDVYKWVITGGAFSFVNGTSASNRYPQVMFNDYKTYKVQLTYANSCGSKTISQNITFTEPVTAEAGTSPVSVCFNDQTVSLNATVDGPLTGLRWTTVGTGSFTPVNNAKSTYHLGAGDKANGSVQLILTAFTPSSSACPDVSDTINVLIKPRLEAYDSVLSICSGQTFNFTPQGNQPAATYTWTSKVTSGNITGNSPSGSGTISDVLVNNSTGNGTVTYTIIPLHDQCTGDTGTVVVSIRPAPSLTTIPDIQSICSEEVTDIRFTSNITNVDYSWVASAPSSLSGYSSGSGSAIRQKIINSGNLVDTVHYSITSFNGTCAGENKVAKVAVYPKAGKPVVDSPVPYCLNSPAAPLSATAAPGNTLTWYDNPGLTGGSPTAPTPSTATPGSVTYYVNQKNAYGCVSDVSIITVTTYEVITNNAVGSDQALCAGTVAAPLVQTSGSVTGGSGTYTYQWQRSTDGGASWTNINGAADPSYSPGIVAATTLYRRIVTGGPCTSTSNEITITIQGVLTNYEIGSNQTICEGNAPALLVGQQPAGGNGTFVYQWQSSADNSTWTDINGATARDYQPPVLSTTTYYHRVVTSGPCTATSASVAITVNPLPTGSISAAPESICVYDAGAVSFTASTGTAPFAIRLTVTGPGGPITIDQNISNNGPASIQVLPAGSAFGDYTVSLVKIADSKGCERNGNLDTVSITVKPVPVVTITPAAPSVCFGSSVSLTAGGAAGYSWSPSGGLNTTQGADVIASPAATTTYTVTGTTNGCSATATVTVTVNPKPVKPGVNTPVTYCQFETATVLTATPAPGHTIRWYDNPGLTNGTTVAPTPSTAVPGTVTYYVTQVNSFNCESDAGVISVITLPDLSNNIIGSDQTLCSGTVPAPLTPQASLTGGTGSYTYQWESSANGGITWSDINGATSASFAPGALTATANYRRKVNSGSCTSSSNIVTITVQGILTNYEIGSDQTICEGSTPALLVGQQPIGGNGTFVYQWQSSPDNSTWTDINGATAKDYQPPVLSTTAYYRRKLTSGECSAISGSVGITVNPVPALDQVADTTVKNGAQVPAIVFNSTPSANVTFTWTNNNTGIGLPASGTGNLPAFTATNTSNPKVAITGTITVTPVYTQNGVSCPGTAMTFNITVLPTLSILPIPNEVVCTGTTIPALTPETDAGPNAQVSFSWVVTGSGITLDDGSGTFIPSYQTINTGTTDLVATITVTPYVTDNGVTSEGTSTFYTVTVKPATPPANAGPDTTLCAVSEYTMQAAGVSGTTGMWTQTGGSNVTIINPSLPGTNITGLQPGTTYEFEWTLTGFAGCPTTKDVVVVTNRPVLTKAAAGADQAICDLVNTGTVTLDANKDASRPFETYEWTVVSKPAGSAANISSASDPKATFTADKAGVYILEWTITNDAGCDPSTDRVTITAYDKPVAGTVSGSTDVCAGNDVTLSLNDFTGQIRKWQYNPAPVDDNIWLDTAVTASTITFADVQGTFAARAVVGSAGFADGCTSEEFTEPLLINVAPSSNPGTTGPDAAVCFGINSGTITLTGNVGLVVRWEYSENNGTDWIPVDNTTNTIDYSDLSVTRWYRAAVQSGTCGLVYSSITRITVQPLVSNNTITADQGICTGTAAAPITGSTPQGGNGSYQYQWQQSTDGGTNWSVIPGATGKDYNPSAVAVTTRYRRLVTTVLCPGLQPNISNEVTVTVNPDATAEFTFTRDVDCSPFVLDASVISVTDYPDRNGRYDWYVNGTLLGTGSTFPGYTITGSGQAVTVRMVAISLFGCKSDTMEHEFSTIKEPVPGFTLSPTEGCGPLTVQFTNTTPSASDYTFHWDFGNGQTSDEAQPGPVTFLTNPTYEDTVYTITLTAASVCKGVPATSTVLVKSKPKAVFIPGSTLGCSPMKVTFRNNSLGVGNTYIWNFGDGSAPVPMSTAEDVTHTFISANRDTFYVKLIATNECGTDETEFAVVVTPNTIDLNVVVPGTELSGCAPHTVRFTNSSRGATFFRWDFGDGTIITTTRNNEVVSHTFQNPGTYTVAIYATNGCSEANTVKTITVFPTPVAAFDVSTLNACVGETVRFTNKTTGANAYVWNFGDGRTSNSSLNEVTNVYATPGIYTVKLNAFYTNVSGRECSDEAEVTITVTSSISGWFDASETVSNCPPATITFTNRNTPSVSAVWDFNDGSTATGNVVTHTFTNAGDYQVKLTSRSPGGCTTVTTRLIRVLGPSGTLSYTGGNICNNASVRFEVTSSNINNTLLWNFGDGVTMQTTDRVVFHTYVNPGTYTPSVSLNDNSGCTVVLRGTSPINVDKVKSGFIQNMQMACGTTSLQLTDTSTATSGKARVFWRLGDGTTATGSTVSKVYTISGDYTIQQVVTGNSGCADSTTRTIRIQVNSQPTASILAEPVYCTNTPVILNGVIQSADPVTSLKWFVSNGATGTTNPYQLNLVPGTYTVRLVVGTANGCFDEASHTFTVNPSPVVQTGNDVTICKGNSTQLSATGALQYSWSPIEGLSCTNCPNPVATPAQTTRYIVSGTNSFGCSATDTVLATVVQPFKLEVKPSDTVCIGQSVQLVARGAAVYSWSPATGLSATNISNPVARPTTTTVYRLEGRDAFNCFTDVAFVQVVVGLYPSVSLGPDLTLATGTKHKFNPVVQNGPVRSWLWTPSTDLDCATCATPEATVKRDITYTARVTNIYGCSASDSINIKAFCQNTQVFIPNAFTPDGDGVNDLLMVRASGIASVKSFRIFNRWGEVVFEKSGFAPNDPRFGWDGKVRGLAGAPEVYVYTAEVVCENGTSYVYKGNVSLLK